jgi:hypothetical protein
MCEPDGDNHQAGSVRASFCQDALSENLRFGISRRKPLASLDSATDVPGASVRKPGRSERTAMGAF